MDLKVSRESDVPIPQQLAEQILVLIATESLKPGEPLPSVRELARRLKIHHNTVSQAYQDLSRRKWIAMRRGSRARVLPREERAEDIDDLINATIRLATERGYPLRTLIARVRKRMLAQTPDRYLVVVEEPELRQLLQREIETNLPWPTEGCSIEALATNPELGIGTQVVTPLIYLESVTPLASKERPVIPITYEPPEEIVRQVSNLSEPSMVAVVSVSTRFLHTASSLLAPAIGQQHSLREFLYPLESPNALKAADFIICDSIAHRKIRNRRTVHYRMISSATIKKMAEPMQRTGAHKKTGPVV